MALLPAYSLMLGFIALLGYMALAAKVKPVGGHGQGPRHDHDRPAAVQHRVPALVRRARLRRDRHRRPGPGGHHGHRGGEHVRPRHLPAVHPADGQRSRRGTRQPDRVGGAQAGRGRRHRRPQVSFAIELQLIGGVIIIEILPAVVFGLYTRWFHHWALVAGWVVGMGLPVYMLYVHPQQDGDALRQRVVRVQHLGLQHQGDHLDRDRRAGREPDRGQRAHAAARPAAAWSGPYEPGRLRGGGGTGDAPRPAGPAPGTV